MTQKQLRTTKYKRFANKDRDGFVSTFQLTPLGKRFVGKSKQWWVLQNVDLVVRHTTAEGVRHKAKRFSFSEIFHKKTKRTRLEDFFTVSKGHRIRSRGVLEVKTQAWVVKRRPKGYRISKAGDEPWGTQPGRNEQAKEPGHGGVLHRHYSLVWDNTKGKKQSMTNDITLVQHI